MRVGFFALGKLGSACAVAACQRGHEVWGYDCSPAINYALQRGRLDDYSDEPGINDEYDAVRDRFHVCATPLEVVENCDLLLLSPPTPALRPSLEGSRPWNHEFADFDYSFLQTCVAQVADAINTAKQDRLKTVVVMSTVLPGTTRRLLLPLMQRANAPWSLIYSPSFIAQSTTVKDYHAPEFALIGDDGYDRSGPSFYRTYLQTIHDAPLLHMSWENAELAKMTYNTVLGMKLQAANATMELCDRLNRSWGQWLCDIDTISDVWSHATDRLISPKYYRGGAEDGGPCHGRDCLALAYLANKHHISSNIWEFQADSREARIHWLAERVIEERGDLPIVLLGDEFKAGTSQTIGSPNTFLRDILKKWCPIHVYSVSRLCVPPPNPACYVLCVNDKRYLEFLRDTQARGVAVDPWGWVPHQEGLRVVLLGRSA